MDKHLLRFSQESLEKLKVWFLQNKRSLPWRENPSPYEVWISETMLQQTQVSVVIPYYKRWMQRFPTLEDLSDASIDEVLKMWEGLGYYSRARRLHSVAQSLIKKGIKEIPSDRLRLLNISGLGPYTVGAILSFAFKQKATAVDGNVMRLITRLFAIEKCIDRAETKRFIEEIIIASLPDDEPWVMMEAFIELGALICQKKPQCGLCPLQKKCLAYRQGNIDLFPRKAPRPSLRVLHRLVAVITSAQHVLLQKGKQGRVMADLWEFPYFEIEGKDLKLCDLQMQIKTHFPFALTYLGNLPSLSHGFTHFKAHLYPYLWEADACYPIDDFMWIAWEDLKTKTFSAGHRRILESAFYDKLYF